MIAEWYKSHGYNFLVFSEHNLLQAGSKWISVTNNRGGLAAFHRYLARFGSYSVDYRTWGGKPEVRLKTLAEFRNSYEQRDRFLLIPGEEITDKFETRPVHLNAINPASKIEPQGGSSVVAVLQRNVDAVLLQRQFTRQAMFPHINHPNFGYAITAEDLMQIRGERFFEIYNGHPTVNNFGDEYHAGLERVWDLVLTFRLRVLNLGVMFGIAVDDAHQYHAQSPTNSNPGRGWVMVRASRLSPEAIIAGLEAGDFYPTTGVILRNVIRGTNRLSLEIEAEQGVAYTTEFIGTRRIFNARSEPGERPPGTIFPVTRKYSDEIGTVLDRVEGVTPSYQLRGDEIYVRARVVSTKPKANAVGRGEMETAWSQPLIAPLTALR